MKSLIILILLAVFSFGCYKEQKSEDMPAFKLFKGNHELRKMITKDSLELNSVGYFYVSASHMETGMKVYFSWLSNDGNYINSSFPIEKVRVKIDNSLKTPYVTFATITWVTQPMWGKAKQDYKMNNKQDYEYLNNVDYYNAWVEVNCSEKDYPENISLPLNK